LYNDADVEKVMSIYRAGAKKQDERLLGRMSSALKPVADRYEDLEDDVKYDFRISLRNFGKWYNYISQLIRMLDMELLEESIFTKYLLGFLPTEKREHVDIDDKIRLDYYKITEEFSGSIDLVKEDSNSGMLENINTVEGMVKPPSDDETLEEIIHKVNDRFPTNFTEADRVIITTLYKNSIKDEDHRLENMAKNNDAPMFVNDLYKKEFQQLAMNQYKENKSAFEKLFKDKEYYQFIMHTVGRETYKELRSRKDDRELTHS
jgi:type I restriction enzyme R subunit